MLLFRINRPCAMVIRHIRCGVTHLLSTMVAFNKCYCCTLKNRSPLWQPSWLIFLWMLINLPSWSWPYPSRYYVLGHTKQVPGAKSMLKSMLVNKGFLAWLLIGWRLCCQPMRYWCDARFENLTWMLTWKFHSNPGACTLTWCVLLTLTLSVDRFVVWKSPLSTHGDDL